MSGANPYQPPSAAPASSTSTEELKKTSVLLVILLNFITAGFYVPYWYTSRRMSLNRLAGTNDINLGLCIAAFILQFLTLLPSLEGRAPSWIDVVVAISYAIVFLVLAFRVKNILEGNFRVALSVVLTFFLNVLYLQYKINRLEPLEEALQGLPATSLGLR